MKKIILFAIFSMTLINASCQSNSFLFYFPLIKNDSIFNTMYGQTIYYNLSLRKSLPDSISLKYIFDNNEIKMYGLEEGYNVDTDEYSTITYVKKVKPIFKKKVNDYYLVCYGFESILYLSIYDPKLDKILSSIVISDFSDEMGNILTHSIVFPSSYIVKIKIENKIRYELIEIDYVVPKFELIKQVEVNNVIEDQKSIINKAFTVLEITSKGEPIK